MQTHTPRAWVEIDLGALMRNAASLRKRAAVPLLPVVKADAYGLGAGRIVQALEAAQPWGYGVATLDEGLSLRKLGITRPVVLFTPTLIGELAEIRANHLTPALGDRDVISEWATHPGDPWHLAIETGMNRTGVRWTDVASFRDLLVKSPPQGAFTHFHSSERDDGSKEEQEERFREAVADLPQRPLLLHTENSAAIARRDRSQWDLIRPGIFLYGVGSGPTALVQPDEVVSLCARIVEIHDVPPGDTVSYGAAYQVPQGSGRRIATTALGYADGYRRVFSNVGHATVRGRNVPVVGMVTMDMTMVDVTGVECGVGDVATFLGRAGGRDTSFLASAESVDLSPYELMSTLRSRLPRIYTGPDQA
jgi:alanine racemase